MIEMIEANWLLILLALLLGLLVAWYVFHASRKTRVSGDRRDVLDDGAAPAARNQALIDAKAAAAADPPAPTIDPAPAPSAAPAPAPATASAPPREAPPVVPPVTPPGLAGVGEVIGAAVEHGALERAEAAPAPTGGDDLTRIKGVGPKLAARLGELGVTSFAQIAAWDEAAIDRVDAELGRFQGRIRRDSWVEQADYLARGDAAGFAARFGNL